MKKIYLIICLTFSLNAFSQIPKGSMFGGLSLGFANQKSVSESKDGPQTVIGEPSIFKSYNVRPEFSYLIIDDLALGAFIGFAGSSNETTTYETTPDRKIIRLTKNAGPSFGIFARKFWKVNDHLHTFAGLGLSMNKSRGTTTVTTIPETGPTVEVRFESENTLSEADINFGLAYHLSQSFMLMSSISALRFYSETQRDNIFSDSYDQTKNTGVDFIFDTRQTVFNLGFIYLLNAKGE